MAKKIIRTGTTADPTGDSLKNAFVKVNDNFTELYNALGLVTDITLNLGNFKFTGSTLSLDDPEDSTLGITIDTLVKINSDLSVGGDILPQTALGGDLGSSTLPWRSLYVSNNTIYIGGVAIGLDASNNLTVSGSRVGTTSYADLSGKPTFATVATSGAYADLTGKPTIPTLVSQLSNDSGFLTSVGNISNIQSEGNINIEVNLSDSTKRIWQFGEDGDLILPAGGDIKNSTGTSVLGGSVSSLVNGAYTVSLGSDGVVTFPGGVFTISNYQASTQIETWTVGVTNISPTNSISFYGHSSKLFDTTWTISGSGITGQSTITAINPIMSVMSIIGYTVIIAQTISAGLVTGDYVFSNPPITQGVNLSSDLSTWTFGNDGSLTFPNGTVQTTAPESFSFNVAADDSTQRVISNNELIKFTGAGGITTASDAEGNITINYVQGDIRSNGNINIDINLADSTLRRWQFGEDGDTVFPNNVSINYSGDNIQFPRIIADSGKAFSVQGQGTSGSAALSWTVDPDAAGQYAAVGVSKGGGDNLAKVILQAQSDSGDAGTAKIWKFDEAGKLTLPAGGVISENGGLTGNAIKLTPAGGANANQALLIYPTGFAEGDHIHLTAGGGSTELYLGDDDHYVKLASNGSVVIKPYDVVNGAVWGFSPDGTTSIPGDIKSDSNINIEINLSDSTLRRWQFGEDGILTVPGPISGLGNAKLDFTTYANVAYLTSTSDDTTALYMGSVSAELYAQTNILIRTNTDGASKQWTFSDDGGLTLPGEITLPNGAVIRDTADDAVAFGQSAGATSQGTGAVAIGSFAGNLGQSLGAISIGPDAGQTNQGWRAIAIGALAGPSNQGQFSIAIGYGAGNGDAVANSIIINATGSNLVGAAAGFYVAPIRNISATSGVLQYNASTKEVSYSLNVTAETFNTDQITVVGNRITTTVTNANLELECNGTGGVVINTLADATTASTVKSVGYLGLPQSATATSATLAIGDAGKHIYVTTNSQTITIPANASVAYPIGTTLTFIAGPSPVVTVTIAITSDTLRLAGGTSTGTRTLAANGMATAVKVAATTWYINGTGLT